MVIGASWNGARAFTATSGPGISLMNEFLGPRLLRRDPGGDLRRAARRSVDRHADAHAAGRHHGCAYASHGDTRHVCLYPANPEECFYMAVQAFDLAERLQTPVFVLSDLDIGMNDWMCRDLEVGRQLSPDRGKVLEQEELEKLEKFYRYLDKDGDGIPLPHAARACIRRAPTSRAARATTSTAATPRTPPSTRRSSTACCASGQTREDAACRAPSSTRPPAATIGIVSIGSCDGAVREAIDVLEARGVGARLHARARLPVRRGRRDVPRRARAAVRRRAEPRRAAPSLLTLETAVEKAKLRSMLHYGGLPIPPFIVERALPVARRRVQPTDRAGCASDVPTARRRHA